jgi:DNA-binding response OmpR family regulator
VVLIVEDDPDVASFLETTLGDDHETRVAADGRSAQKLLDRITPDLIVLDVRLPFVSGVELCHMIRSSERLRCTPILVVTAFPDSAEVSRIRQMGVERILSKPVTPRRLREAAHAILRGPGPTAEVSLA